MADSTPDSHPGSIAPVYSHLEVDDSGVVIEAVKLAEDTSGIVVRLYECENRKTRTTLRTGFDISGVWEVNLMEEDPKPIPLANNSVPLEFDFFGIKTVRLDRFSNTSGSESGVAGSSGANSRGAGS